MQPSIIFFILGDILCFILILAKPLLNDSFFKVYDNKASGVDDNTFRSLDHTVTLTNLDASTYYYYKIIN